MCEDRLRNDHIDLSWSMLLTPVLLQYPFIYRFYISSGLVCDARSFCISRPDTRKFYCNCISLINCVGWAVKRYPAHSVTQPPNFIKPPTVQRSANSTFSRLMVYRSRKQTVSDVWRLTRGCSDTSDAGTRTGVPRHRFLWRFTPRHLQFFLEVCVRTKMPHTTQETESMTQ